MSCGQRIVSYILITIEDDLNGFNRVLRESESK